MTKIQPLSCEVLPQLYAALQSETAIAWPFLGIGDSVLDYERVIDSLHFTYVASDRDAIIPTPIGLLACHDIDFQNGVVGVAFLTFEAARRTAKAIEPVALYIDLLFRSFVRLALFSVPASSSGAIGLLGRAPGVKHFGTLEQHLFTNGYFDDVQLFGVYADDWRDEGIADGLHALWRRSGETHAPPIT